MEIRIMVVIFWQWVAVDMTQPQNSSIIGSYSILVLILCWHSECPSIQLKLFRSVECCHRKCTWFILFFIPSVWTCLSQNRPSTTMILTNSICTWDLLLLDFWWWHVMSVILQPMHFQNISYGSSYSNSIFICWCWRVPIGQCSHSLLG